MILKNNAVIFHFPACLREKESEFGNKGEKLSWYFDNIERKKLEDQQRTAVVTDEYSNLIVAGAGSGKTLTIPGRAQYWLNRKTFTPLISYYSHLPKKTVEELNERLHKIQLGSMR